MNLKYIHSEVECIQSSANVGVSENRHKADTWNSASTSKDGNTADSMDKNDIC